jgi:hypothetical protein
MCVFVVGHRSNRVRAATDWVLLINGAVVCVSVKQLASVSLGASSHSHEVHQILIKTKRLYFAPRPMQLTCDKRFHLLVSEDKRRCRREYCRACDSV